MVGTSKELIKRLIELPEDKKYEVWKDIKGYEHLYQVSNLGRVKRIAFLHGKSQKILHSEKILKPIINKKNGYVYYGLSKNGVKHIRAHKLVLSTFNPVDNNKLQINHKNGNKQDNSLENLEWCTCKENIQHAFNNGLKQGRRDSKNSLSKKVAQYDLENNLIRVWDSTMQVERTLGYKNASISHCCLGRIRKSHNYIWRYL